MFLDTNICSKKSFVIVQFLGRRYNESFYVREIAKELNLSLGPVSETLKELEKAGLLHRKVRGRIVTYRANMESPILREMKILITLIECADFLKELENSALRVILFGSCARGEDTNESDIDIMVETGDRESVDQIVNLNDHIGDRKLSAIVLSPVEFRAMREKDRPFYERVMQGKMILRREEDEVPV